MSATTAILTTFSVSSDSYKNLLLGAIIGRSAQTALISTATANDIDFHI
jgi:hypothetical protein